MLSSLDLSTWQLVLIFGWTLVTSVIHGASGLAGGFLLAAMLTPMIGIKNVMPVVSVTLLITGSTRILINLQFINWKVLRALIFPAVPAALVVSSFYGSFSGAFVAALLGTVMVVSIPLRRIAKKLKFDVRLRDLSIVGGIWGALTGASIGPGMLMIPFLLNYGLVRESLVVTMSATAILVHVSRITGYTATGVMTLDLAVLGLLTGLVSLPGNWAGRSLLRRISDETHIVWIEVLMVLGAINFFWIALR